MLHFPFTHHQAGQIINGCWYVTGAVWLVGMFNAKKAREKWSSTERIGYSAICIFSYYLMTGRMFPTETVLIHHGRGFSTAAAVVCITGSLIAVWARLILGRNWSSAVTYKEDHELIERGPYRYIRHPIYTGLLLLVLGTAVLIGTLAAFTGLAILIVIHIWKLRREEALLNRYFPDSYPSYRARTKALIPFLY